MSSNESREPPSAAAITQGAAAVPRRFPVPLFVLLGMLGTALLFVAYPELDLMVSGGFYADGEFFLRRASWVRFLYDYGELPVRFVAFGAGGVALVLWAMRRGSLLGWSRKVYLYLFLAGVLGPALVVNGVFKEHFDRARPVQVEAFGGDKQFTPAFIIADQCERNCSFVSSHAACGFYFVALGFLFGGRWRRFWFASGIAAGALVGAGRILQGGHFLSDVIFAGVFVYLSAAVLHYLMFREQYARPGPTP